MELKKISSNYNGKIPSTGKEVEEAFNENADIIQESISDIKKDLQTKASKEDVSMSLLYNPDVATKSALYTTYPSPVNGDASLVKDEGYIYQYRNDKFDWVKTPYKAFPQDVFTKSESTIFNVTYSIPLSSGQYYTEIEARASVPMSVRKPGLEITYQIDASRWITEQYINSDISKWSDTTYWKNISSDRVFDGGRADTRYGGAIMINCGKADSF